MSGSNHANAATVVDVVKSLRAERGEFLNALSNGTVPATSVFARIQAESALHQLYVVKVVESLPHVGKVQARRALGSLGIDELSPAVDVDQAAWGALLAGDRT
jgi:hypothetical protein